MPGWTLAQLTTEFRQHLGDDQSATWTDAQLQTTLARASRDAWPYFFTPIQDLTSYTGANALAANTLSINVPAAFLASGSGVTSVPAGRISQLETRMWDGSTSTTPIPARWFPLQWGKGWEVDPLDMTQATPQIKFWEPYSYQCELRIFGGVPITPFDTTNLSAVLAPTAYNGFVEWLLWKAEELARSERIKANSLERRGQNTRRLLAQQNAQDAARRYRMRMYGD